VFKVITIDEKNVTQSIRTVVKDLIVSVDLFLFVNYATGWQPCLDIMQIFIHLFINIFVKIGYM